MALTTRDEWPHPPPADRPGWQENWFFLGWDDTAGAGVYFHLARTPAEGTVEARVAAVDRGRIVSTTVAGADSGDLAVPGGEVEVKEEFRRLRLRFDGVGHEGADPEGFVATRSGGEVPLGLDVELTTEMAPVDWSDLLARMGVAGTERDHYEQGLRMEGSIVVGGEERGVTGLAVRDHTWGVRDYSTFDHAWWTPSVFDDGTFVTGVTVVSGEAAVGGGFLCRLGEEPEPLAGYEVRVVEGEPDWGRYRRVAIETGAAGPIEATCRMHVPVLYPKFSDRFLSSEGYSALEWDGRRGFGTVEINRSVPAEERLAQ